MSGNYIGEIRLFAGDYVPENWLKCDGSPLPISRYDVLFTLIGTTYGGDGVTTFNLPDLRSRVPVHQGAGGYGLGQASGVEKVTLLGAQAPVHTHGLQATSSGLTASPANALPALLNSELAGTSLYGTGSTKPTTLSSQTVAPNPGGQPHNNIQPYLCATFIISPYGIYPPRS
jgi:microcystin-dependent protein